MVSQVRKSRPGAPRICGIKGRKNLSSESKPVENFVEHPKTLAELRAGIVAGTTKAADLAAGYYERIAQKNPRLNVYLSLTKERALAQAAKMDEAAAKGDPLPVLAGIPVGIKDVLVMQRRPGDGGVEDFRGLLSALRRDGGGQAGGGGRGAAGQAELRRVCHGRLERELGIRAGAQSGRHGAGSGRLQRRLGGGGGGKPGRGHARLGHRRLNSPAGQLLRRRRRAADLWTRLALRADRLCLVAGPRGALRRQCPRRRHACSA